MRAKKSLGQNFLTSRGAARDIVNAAEISARDTVLEIGPGKGFLTAELLRSAGRVIAVEKDDRLIGLLEKKFVSEIAAGKLHIIHQDITDFSPSNHPLLTADYKLVANIPYYITGQIIRAFLESDHQPKSMTLLVQKEVAERIVARDGKESILSISVRAYGEPRYIKKVPARYFSPQPKVNSAILLIDNISKKHFKDTREERTFFELVKKGFAHKRKMLLGNLKNFYDAQDLKEGFAKCGIPQTARAEKLSLLNWQCLSRYINRP